MKFQVGGALACPAGGVGMRESENIRKSAKAPSASTVSQLADGTTLFRFSMFSESPPERMFIRAGGLKHSARLSFFEYFFCLSRIRLRHWRMADRETRKKVLSKIVSL